jgi:hypothetical protein
MMLNMVVQIFKVAPRSSVICHFKEGENKKMLTLYCCHVASCWLIKSSLLNCSTPYIFYLTSHLIKKYDEKNYWTWNSPCLFGVVLVNIYRQYQIPLSQFMHTIFHTYHHRYTSLLQTRVRIYIIHI